MRIMIISQKTHMYLDICIQINELLKVLWGDVILGGLKIYIILGNQGGLEYFSIVNMWHILVKVFWGDVIGGHLSEKSSLKVLGWCYPGKITHECNCHYHFAVLWIVFYERSICEVMLSSGDQRPKLCWVLHTATLLFSLLDTGTSSVIVVFDILACPSRIMKYMKYMPFTFNVSMGTKASLVDGLTPLISCLCTYSDWAPQGDTESL